MPRSPRSPRRRWLVAASVGILKLAPGDDIEDFASGRHFTVEQRQQLQENLRQSPTSFFIGGKKELINLSKVIGAPSGLSAYIEEWFASLLPNTSVQVELAMDEDGVPRGFGSMGVGDYSYAESVLEAIGQPRSNGQPGFVIDIGDASIQVGPSWGKGATVGSRRMVSTTRRNASTFISAEFAALASALELDPEVAGQADVSACRQLELKLQEAVRKGLPPSFEDDGARAVYTMERLPSRVGHVFDALLGQDVAVQRLREELFASGRQCLRVASIAGGPGFDIVGLALLAKYLGSTVKLECTVFERELGWGAQLNRVVKHLQDRVAVAGQASALNVQLAPCDITLPLSHAANAGVEAAAASADIFVVSYVVHEVESLIRAPGTASQQGVGGLLPDLFRLGEQRALSGDAGPSVSFWFFDASTRMWPAIAGTGKRFGFECYLPKMLRSRGKPQEPVLLTRRHPAAELVCGYSGDDAAVRLEEERRHAASRFAVFERYLSASDSVRMASRAA